MLEEELEQITVKKKTKANLKQSLLALLLLTLSSVSFIADIEYFFADNYAVFLLLLVFYYGFLFAAAYLSIQVISQSIKTIKQSNSIKNFIALFLCLLILFAIAAEVYDNYINGY